MSTQEFAIPPPGKFAALFPLLIGLVLPVIILAVFASTVRRPAEWLAILPAMLILPLASAYIAWQMHRRTLRLVDGELRSGRLPWHRTAIGALDLAAAGIVSLDEHRELQPVRCIAGTAMPGYRAGFFRLRDKRRAYVLVTDPRRVLVLPKRDGGVLMFSLERPQALLDALRRAADDKAGSAR
jgi:hypothetical protein